ncbi:segregation/condensation protein A [Candidatus Woesearchaeota archaeon]|nr:segregation/condensation protein A [Candidatus Woesearchaeota archaeon]
MNKEQQRLAEPSQRIETTVILPNQAAEQPLSTNDQIIDLVLNKDDISWQQIIFTAVKAEDMNPWDIDIRKLSQAFLIKLREFKEMDFKISGKVILAAAIMLRLKSNKLIGEDMNYLDQLIASSNKNEEDAFYDELASMEGSEKVQVSIDGKNFELIPRTPQPRKRKVSVYDLVEALEKALEVKNRRKGWGDDEIRMVIPTRKVDIELLIGKTFAEVMEHFMTQKEVKLMFHNLLKAGTKEEKVFTFIPLLHLSNTGKVNLYQEVHLGDIHITLGEKAYETVEGEKKD